MKHRATSLPHQDPKVIQLATNSHRKYEDDNKAPHISSFINRNNMLCIDSIIKEDIRGNNKIIIRRNKQKFQKASPTVESNMRKTMNYLSNRYQMQQINRSSNLNEPQSEKQKFIDILQNKILKNQNEEKLNHQNKEADKNKVDKKGDSSRYHNLQPQTYRVSIPANKMNESFEENREYSIDKRHKIRSQRVYHTQNHMPIFRSRSRTLAREQNDIKISPKSKENQISRTIELQPQQQRMKLHKSLIQIQRFEKNSLAKDTRDVQININKITQQMEHTVINVQTSQNKQSVLIQDIQTNVNNTEIYEKQINVLTKDFFQEWERMNSNKSKIYQNLRKKLVSVFPFLRKNYKQFEETATKILESSGRQQLKRNSVEQAMIFANDLNSDLKVEKPPGESIHTFSNLAEVKDFQEKMQEFHQKQQLKDIFKQAYFWSRTKNKSMSTSLLNEQEMEKKEMVQLKKIQKNLTFMNYMKSKTNKSEILHNRNKIKGANIIKNKDSILEIQKQGTRQQQFLKKCLDNAIQNCMKQYQ